MFKQTSKKFVILIGVALSVVPIFSHAQDSNQQLKMLEEIQALRTELAELRDMVERQQHQLSQMQRSPQIQQQFTRSPYQTNQYGQPQQNTQATLNPNLGISTSLQSVNPSYGVPVNAAELNQQTANEYLPYPYNGELNQTPNANVVIEERHIDQNGTNAVAGVQGLTPVEERSIGQALSGEDNLPPNDQFDSNQQTISSIQPALTLNPNGGQTIRSQTFQQQSNQINKAQPQIQSGTNINPLYQPSSPNQFPQTAVPIGQAADLSTAAIPAVLAEKDYYQQGFDLLKQSKHSEAVSVFKQQISSYPQSDLADDAHYWIAESMYVNRDLENAKQYFKVIIDSFAQSPRLPDAMLKTAYIEQEQGNQIEARILLQEIIQYHPRSNAAISAKNRLTELN